MSANPDAVPPASGHPIRIVVVDDHMLVREGLVSLLDPQPDLQVVGQAGSVREAITVAQDLRPDVVLMDFTLPDGTGEEATRAILATLPATKIVFLTVHDDDERLFAAIAAGATGYLLKSMRSADLLSRLRDVARGEVAFSPATTQRILAEVARRSRSAR
jgi:DNA-binding NarL/FixJ family response regulator